MKGPRRERLHVPLRLPLPDRGARVPLVPHRRRPPSVSRRVARVRGADGFLHERLLAETEDGFLEWIIGVARAHGWLVYHVRNSRAGIVQGDIGFPDLVLVKNVTTMFVEVKREGKRLDPAQIEWAIRLLVAGSRWDLWRPSDRPVVEATLTDRAPFLYVPALPVGMEDARRIAAGIVAARDAGRSVDGEPPVGQVDHADDAAGSDAAAT